MTRIGIDNYRQFLSKRVKVDIFSYSAGVVYPTENILIGMNDSFFYFYSDEEGLFWHVACQPNGGNHEDEYSVEVYYSDDVNFNS